MKSSGKTFSELICLLKSWIPWHSEPASVSRDFWMPDQSCRVCYECDSQFTIFNRRHHCRLCGRVFCAKCTTNSVPVPSSDPRTVQEDLEKIRVCNYCSRQWQQGLATFDDGIQVPSLDLSSSPSAASFISTRSCGTAYSSSITVGSLPYLDQPNQQAQHSSRLSPPQATEMETSSDEQGEVKSARCKDPIADIEYRSPDRYAFSVNRYDDDLLSALNIQLFIWCMHQECIGMQQSNMLFFFKTLRLNQLICHLLARESGSILEDSD